MEIKSPAPCPKTVTVRRNPPRRARPTPATVVPVSAPPSSKTSSAIRSFPIQDILSINIPDKQEITESSSSPPKETSPSEKLKVFLRIKPIVTQSKVGVSLKNAANKNVWPQNPSKKKDAAKTAKAAGKKTSEICLKMNDEHSVTLCPPQSLADARRTKSEVYEGFSHVFCAESSQSEVYDKMVNPLVEDFLKGKSGMLAAMGPSGSGKTHTVFGSTREPGMVPLALRQIFSEKKSNESKCSRTFYLSMFEIYSERGKGEKIMDLSQDGGDLFMQQSNIKGLKETVIHDVRHAESLIASGMLKRSTAMTNSNIQSSRSQCIINIRSDIDNVDFHSYFNNGVQSCTALLTIVDLAGAEREKRTGNQGTRLLESNFINNTSMVFGLCLRALLEHQKNPKKPFHKHFQNSMLTKYLRDFLEGKKRMALILTAKSGEEDYQDTSYLLRQASPFMNIKFENIVEEQPANVIGNKKRTQTLPKVEKSKRMKLNSNEVSMDDEVKGDILHEILKEESTPEKVKEVDEFNNSSVESPSNNMTEVNKKKSVEGNIDNYVKTARENHILLNFSRALWNVLKEYKNKLEASEHEVNSLRHSLMVEKERNCALENELKVIKSSCLCGKKTVEEILVVEENESKATSANCSLEATSCVEDVSTSLNGQSFEEQSKEKDDIAPCEYVVFDKEDLKDLEDKELSCEIAGCDTLVSAVNNSELVIQEDEISSFVKGDQQQHEKEERIISFEVISISSGSETIEEQCNEKVDVSRTNVVPDKQELKEVVERELNKEIASCDTLTPAGSESEFSHVLEDEVSCSPLKEDQPKHEEKEVSYLTSNDLKNFEEQCNKKVDEASIHIISDKQEIKEVEEKEGNEEISGGGDTKLPLVHADEVVSSTLEEDQSEHDKKEKIGVSNTNDKQELKEVVERELNGEIAGCDTLLPAGSESEVSFVHEDEVSSSPLKEDQPKHEEKEACNLVFNDLTNLEEQCNQKVDEMSTNVVSDKQEIKEVEDKEANEEISGGGDTKLALVHVDEVSSTLEKDQSKQDKKEVISNPDLVCPEKVVSSQGCNESKLQEISNIQTCQSNSAMKPKRRLRPASSVMLRNINILDSVDATDMPKHGKRGGEKDVGGKRTQGSISLMRILKQNIRH